MVRGRANPRFQTFPLRLKRARKAAGLSCAELSRRAGIGTYTVAAVEAGLRRPRLPVIESLGDALQLSAAYLAYGLNVPWAPREGDKMRCAGMAQRAKAVREAAGLSLRDVAGRLGTSASTVQAIERGGMPMIDTAEELADALGLSAAWLGFGEGPRTQPGRRSDKRSAAPDRLPDRLPESDRQHENS